MQSHRCIYLGFLEEVFNQHFEQVPFITYPCKWDTFLLGTAQFGLCFVAQQGVQCPHRLEVCMLRTGFFKHVLNTIPNRTNAGVKQKNPTGWHLWACVDAFLENYLVDQTSQCFESLYFHNPCARGMPYLLHAPFPTRCVTRCSKRGGNAGSPKITQQPRIGAVKMQKLSPTPAFWCSNTHLTPVPSVRILR